MKLLYTDLKPHTSHKIGYRAAAAEGGPRAAGARTLGPLGRPESRPAVSQGARPTPSPHAPPPPLTPRPFFPLLGDVALRLSPPTLLLPPFPARPNVAGSRERVVVS